MNQFIDCKNSIKMIIYKVLIFICIIKITTNSVIINCKNSDLSNIIIRLLKIKNENKPTIGNFVISRPYVKCRRICGKKLFMLCKYTQLFNRIKCIVINDIV